MKKIHGWMNGVDLEWIKSVAPAQKLIIEIGVWEGRSCDQWCRYCPGQVIGVDHWRDRTSEIFSSAFTDRDGLFKKIQGNLGSWMKSGKLALLKLDSLSAAKYLQEAERLKFPYIPSPWGELQLWEPQKADLIFIDALHTYNAVMLDIESWLPMLKSGGILCGHDIGMDTVRQAVDRHAPGWTLVGGDIWKWQKE